MAEIKIKDLKEGKRYLLRPIVATDSFKSITVLEIAKIAIRIKYDSGHIEWVSPGIDMMGTEYIGNCEIVEELKSL